MLMAMFRRSGRWSGGTCRDPSIRELRQGDYDWEVNLGYSEGNIATVCPSKEN